MWYENKSKILQIQETYLGKSSSTKIIIIDAYCYSKQRVCNKVIIRSTSLLILLIPDIHGYRLLFDSVVLE